MNTNWQSERRNHVCARFLRFKTKITDTSGRHAGNSRRGAAIQHYKRPDPLSLVGPP